MDISRGYNYYEAHTKSDTVDVTSYATKGLTHAIAVGTAGNIAAVMQDDTAIIVPVAVGINAIALKRINSTNTTAATFAALYRV